MGGRRNSDRRGVGRNVFKHDAHRADLRGVVDHLVHRDDWKIIRKTLKQARRDAGSYQIEFRICRPDGGVRWCLGTAAASRDISSRSSASTGPIVSAPGGAATSQAAQSQRASMVSPKGIGAA